MTATGSIGDTAVVNEYATKRTEVPGKVLKVEWWDGKRWWVTYEARPDKESA